jgi:hypothetical protein
MAHPGLGAVWLAASTTLHADRVIASTREQPQIRTRLRAYRNREAIWKWSCRRRSRGLPGGAKGIRTLGLPGTLIFIIIVR